MGLGDNFGEFTYERLDMLLMASIWTVFRQKDMAAHVWEIA
jgi:hypothetical protein